MKIFTLFHKDMCTKSIIIQPGGVNKYIHVGDVFGSVGILEQQAETVCHRSVYSDHRSLSLSFFFTFASLFLLS